METILQRARECHPDVTPRIITDNGPQFIARDFQQFIRLTGMTHVKTSPYYPQSNGKIERWHKTLKGECIRPQTPLSLEDARRIVAPLGAALQHRPLALRPRLRDPGRPPARPTPADLRRAGSQAGPSPPKEESETSSGPRPGQRRRHRYNDPDLSGG